MRTYNTFHVAIDKIEKEWIFWPLLPNTQQV